MKRRRYIFTMKLEIPYLTYPNRIKQTHDELAYAIIGAVEQKIGMRVGELRDCKTGRFKKLSTSGNLSPAKETER